MANAVAGKRSKIGNLRADCTNAVIRKTIFFSPYCKTLMLYST